MARYATIITIVLGAGAICIKHQRRSGSSSLLREMIEVGVARSKKICNVSRVMFIKCNNGKEPLLCCLCNMLVQCK